MKQISRRTFLAAAGGALGASLAGGRAMAAEWTPRHRVIIDNDFAGDPDGLYQTAHHLLSPSVDVRMLVGSHSHAGENWGQGGLTAEKHALKASELLKIMHRNDSVKVFQGADRALTSSGSQPSPAATAIIAEALREADGVPLCFCAGAGLTELANAWLLEPRIGPRVRLLWIGGSEYPGVAPPPGPPEAEYNLTIDIQAAQVIFNRSDIDIWQVPRSTYRRMLIGWAELEARSRRCGHLGGFLADSVAAARRLIASAPPGIGGNPGEAYILGASPLTTLTALQSPFQPDPSSSSYELRSCPRIDDKGGYVETSSKRPIRAYTRMDARLTFEDMFAKFEAAAGNG